MLSRSLTKYVLIAALRDRLMVTALLVVLVGTALAIFLGSSAIIEKNRFALVFTAAGLRFADMAALILFIVFYLRRAFESREVDFLLARPISRVAFLCSHAVAFSLLAIVAGLIVSAPVVILSMHHLTYGIALWCLSIICEFVIMANAALFFTMVLTSAAGAAMATFGLYVLARLMGEVLSIIHASAYAPGYTVLAISMKVLSLIVPRLDLMGQSSWLVYDVAPDAIGVYFILLQGLIYSSLLILAALTDLVRRQF